jgi:hypothetical protein
MSRQKPQAETAKNRSQTFDADLNPNAGAGQNLGQGNAGTAEAAPTAYDVKQAHRRLANLTDDNLRQIGLLAEGERLQQGASYVDLRNLEKGEFIATGDMKATADHLFVAKKDVPYHLWNILLGIENKERLADSSDSNALGSDSSSGPKKLF